MNQSALKNYAPKARLDFIQAVKDRAAFFGLTPESRVQIQETGDVVIISGQAFPKVVAQQRKALLQRIAAEGSEAVGNTPEQFTKNIREEAAKWRNLIAQAKIKGE